MALSTKDVKTGGGEGGGLPKTIQPGNSSAEILKVRLDQPSFLKGEDGYFLILEMMTPKPTDDFEGFLLDKDNPDGGRFEGPVGRVKASRWAYRDGTTKTGIEISRDNEIMKFVKNLCEELDMMEWWNNADEKYNTIEEFIEAFNDDAPFSGKSMNYCFCGREYYNGEGYVNYDLYLPKFSKAGIPFESEDSGKGRLLTFNEDDHIEKAKAPEVDGFKSDDTADDDVLSESTPPAEFEL